MRLADAHHLREFLLQITRAVEQPVFVKVGANDGVTGDPCGDLFLTHTNWTGLLIEPVPYLVEKLQRIYGDRSRFTIDPVAVGSSPGFAKFYYVSEEAKRLHPDLPDWYDQLGSFQRQHITNHDGRLAPFVQVMDVTVEPLRDILQRHRLTHIDFLHIDTEGHDLHVLRSVNLQTLAPMAVWVEHKHLSPDDRSAMHALLEGQGYDIWTGRDDFFAVHREADQRLHRNG